MSEIDFHKPDRIYNIQVLSSGLYIRSVGFTLDYILSLFEVAKTDITAVDMGPKARKTRYAIHTNQPVRDDIQRKIDKIMSV